MTTPAEDATLRKFAEKSIKRKKDFREYLVVYAVVSIITTGIWYLTTPTGYFWPVWVFFGMGIGAVFAGLDAYGNLFKKPISQADILDEVERLKTKR